MVLISEKLKNMTIAKVVNSSDQISYFSDSADFQLGDVTTMGYPNLQSEYTVDNDVTDAFHDSGLRCHQQYQVQQP